MSHRVTRASAVDAQKVGDELGVAIRAYRQLLRSAATTSGSTSNSTTFVTANNVGANSTTASWMIYWRSRATLPARSPNGSALTQPPKPSKG